MTAPEFWYRYDDWLTAAPVDEYENPIGETEVHVGLAKFHVLSRTPKGVWLSRYSFGTEAKRFVLHDARKRYACPTVEEAAKSFLARKARQAAILRARLRRVEAAVRLFKKEEEFSAFAPSQRA